MAQKKKRKEERPEAEGEEMDFETALERLEDIVEELESGELGLEESIKKFGEAMRLAAYCEKKLQEAEAKVEEYMASAEEVMESADGGDDEEIAEDDEVSALAADEDEDEDDPDEPRLFGDS